MRQWHGRIRLLAMATLAPQHYIALTEYGGVAASLLARWS
jgi:hypothetical protein